LQREKFDKFEYVPKWNVLPLREILSYPEIPDKGLKEKAMCRKCTLLALINSTVIRKIPHHLLTDMST